MKNEWIKLFVEKLLDVATGEKRQLWDSVKTLHSVREKKKQTDNEWIIPSQCQLSVMTDRGTPEGNTISYFIIFCCCLVWMQWRGLESTLQQWSLWVRSSEKRICCDRCDRWITLIECYLKGQFGSLLAVSLLWGLTNPLMARGSSGIGRVKHANAIRQFVAELKYLLVNWRVSMESHENPCWFKSGHKFSVQLQSTKQGGC